MSANTLSVVIPAHDEEDCIAATVQELYRRLDAEGIEHEILVINDASTDRTEAVLRETMEEIPTLRYLNNPAPHGFGFAVRRGLDHFRGDAVAVVMADAADRPEDLIRYWRTMEATQADCVFGSRFSKGGKTVHYPGFKKGVNRMANTFIRLLFGLHYNDVTNAFKLYRRNVIDGVRPILSNHFNLTVELPLKAIVRGYTYEIVPIHWYGRQQGQSKLLLKEMGSRYLFIVLYCFVEKWLSAGDYYRKGDAGEVGEVLSANAAERTGSRPPR